MPLTLETQRGVSARTPRWRSDQVFGIDGRPPSSPTTKDRPPPAPYDPMGRAMVPLLTVCLLTGLAVWSISKSVQYHEVFTVNRRYRYGLYAVNAAAVFVSIVVLCLHQHKVVAR